MSSQKKNTVLFVFLTLLVIFSAGIGILSSVHNKRTFPAAEAFCVIGEWIAGECNMSEALDFASDYAFGKIKENELVTEAENFEYP